MIELDEADHIPLDQFSLGWRFSDARYGNLPADALARIRAVGSQRAAALAPIARRQCEEEAAFNLTFRSDDRPAAVRDQLRGLPLAPSTRIIVSWDAEKAVVTDWEMFTTYWDDFCYPASDDVTVWPLDAAWTLCYRHYEVFQFSSTDRPI